MTSFLKALWGRVIGSYKSTLVGLGAGIALLAVQQGVEALQGDNRPWVQALASLLVLLGALLKDKSAAPPPSGP